VQHSTAVSCTTLLIEQLQHSIADSRVTLLIEQLLHSIAALCVVLLIEQFLQHSIAALLTVACLPLPSSRGIVLLQKQCESTHGNCGIVAVSFILSAFSPTCCWRSRALATLLSSFFLRRSLPFIRAHRRLQHHGGVATFVVLATSMSLLDDTFFK
jgi:hypothetical protein